MTAVGIVGLGTMGGRMAGRFMAAGDEVVVWTELESEWRLWPITGLFR